MHDQWCWVQWTETGKWEPARKFGDGGLFKCSLDGGLDYPLVVGPEITPPGSDEIERLRAALNTLVGYAEWQIREGPGHHPTLPSAVGATRAILSESERGGDHG